LLRGFDLTFEIPEQAFVFPILAKAACVGHPRILKERGLLAGQGQVEVFVGEAGGYAASRGAIEEAALDEEGFVDFFERVFFFG
jgi:hypothetical protein